MKSIVDEFEKCLEKLEIEEAVILLKANAEEINVVEAEYCMGRLDLVVGNVDEAIIHFNNALSDTIFDKAVYAELAAAYELNEDVGNVEDVYYKLLDMETNSQKRWSVWMMLADFYKKNEMFLKLEKIGKKLIKDYETNYFGYQVLIISKIEREKYAEADVIIEDAKDLFLDNIMFHMDIVTYLEKKKDFQGIIDYLEENDDILKKDRKYKVKKMISTYSAMGDYEKAEQCLFRLAKEFGDVNAMISLVILLLSKEENRSAYVLCNRIKGALQSPEFIQSYYLKLLEVLSEFALIREGSNQISREQVLNSISELRTYLEDNLIDNKEVFDALDMMDDELVEK